jgi:anti-sigma regulatory factor (Ser/Thr protein kinase)
MTEGTLPAAFGRTIKIKPETARLAEVRRFVEDAATEFGLDAEKVFDLKVAVSEACANAVEHASPETSPVEISVFHGAGRLTFVVTDNGRFHTPAPDRSNGNHRGLGLPLMVALMDEVSFCRAPGGGTTVSLSIIIAPADE